MKLREKSAYAAGLVDGEGYITISEVKIKEGFAHRPRIEVNNTNEKIIMFLFDNFGGHVHRPKKCINGHKPKLIWGFYNPKEVELFIQLIYPFLTAKKEHAQTVLSFINKDWHIDGKIFYLKLKELNKRGTK